MDSWKRAFERLFGWEMLNFKFSIVRLRNDDSKKSPQPMGDSIQVLQKFTPPKVGTPNFSPGDVQNSADARNHGGKNLQTSRRPGLLQSMSAWIKFSRLPKIWISSKSIIDSVKSISNICLMTSRHG